MSKQISFDLVRCANIKILQAHWCLQQHFKFTVKFADLFFFFFFPRQSTGKGKFDETIDKGKLPSCLKIANITHVFKKGAPSYSNYSNYRPVGILPVFSKIFEKRLQK